MLERDFQYDVIQDIKRRLPESIVLKNDSGYIQGIPDLIILHGDRWATLEVKKNKKAAAQPNQEYYVNRMNRMSFSSFIFPENKKEVLDELERTLRP